jgi:outer membrane receptor protein involved in Fe transport
VEQEEFMKRFTWIDALKLRASWGKNGNIKNIGLYDTYSTYSASNNIILGGEVIPILTEGRIGNTDLTWETTTTLDFGLDLIVKNGLLGLTVDYYNRLTDGILIQANDIMTETGLSSSQIPARNVGKVRNSGIELTLTPANRIGDLVYNLGFNMTYNKNRIEDLGDRVDQLPPSGYWVFKKGGAIGDFYMLEANGLYSEDDIKNGKYVPYGEFKPVAGMVKYVDQPTENVWVTESLTIRPLWWWATMFLSLLWHIA